MPGIVASKRRIWLYYGVKSLGVASQATPSLGGGSLGVASQATPSLGGRFPSDIRRLKAGLGRFWGGFGPVLGGFREFRAIKGPRTPHFGLKVTLFRNNPGLPCTRARLRALMYPGDRIGPETPPGGVPRKGPFGGVLGLFPKPCQ